LNVFGRLVPGTTLERATSEIAAAASGFAGRYATEYANFRGLTGRALGLEEQLVSGARSLVLALAAVTGLVLLIACANVANLALARTSERRRELAVRAALGAARGRLFRQLVTESLLVSIAGGLVGLGLAALSLDLLVDFVERFTSRTSQIGIDLGVLAYTMAASLVTGVLFGSAPALAAWKRGLVQGVRDGAAQAGDSRGRTRLRTTLVIGQVAVSFVLLVGAGLLLASFSRLSAVPVGYDTDRAITANLVGNFSRFNTPQRALQIQSDVLSRLRASPGVRAAAVTNTVPFTNLQPGIVSVRLEGAPGDQAQQQVQVDPHTASEGYFESLGIPVLTGRSFRESDDVSAPLVAVINTTMARAWQGRDPVGSRFLPPRPFRPSPNGEPEWITVIGIVPDFKLYGIAREVEPQFYLSFRQGGFGGRLIVAANGDPYDLVPTIKAAVHGVDPQIPVEDIQTIADLRHGQLATPGLTAALLAIFAGVALVITLAGIAGVIGTTVSQRTREFGLRMALGATPGSVLRLVLRQGVVMTLAGVAIGVGGALAAGRVLASSLFATEPRDPLVLASVAGVFLLATLVAIWSPARRATSADPLRALRWE
jgi:predicted permease